MKKMITQTIEVTMLYDVYGGLLTQRQQKCIQMHYLDDLSLAEVAQLLDVSRQAVHDNLKRAISSMQELESKLCLLERYQQQNIQLREIDKLLTKAVKKTDAKIEEINLASQKIKKWLKKGGV